MDANYGTFYDLTQSFIDLGLQLGGYVWPFLVLALIVMVYRMVADMGVGRNTIDD
jgi:hypothetical protein